MDKRILFFMITVLILASLACNASAITDQGTESTENEPAISAGDQSVPEDQAQQEALEANAEEEGELAAAGEEQATGQPLAIPIGIREGLASFNSFRMKMSTINNGPTPQDRNESQIEVQFDSENEAQHMHTESVFSTADYPEEESSIEDQYQIGLSNCTIMIDGDYTDISAEEMTPLQRDMVKSTSNLFDMIITAKNPTLVGQETINSIPSNHYTFKVTGLGDYSGSEVTMADGEYWVALDGQYLVKYTLALEVTTGQEGDPATEIMHSEYNFELQETNQPVNIVMPPECTSAASE